MAPMIGLAIDSAQAILSFLLLSSAELLWYRQAMLDVHRLRIFRAVVASGSIQDAAANLGYTPSAVSQHVAALQRETGLALVARVGRGIQPTAAGRALATQADGVLARLGEAEAVVADLRAGRAGTLSVGYFGTAGWAWLPAVVGSLHERYPDLRLRLRLREDLPTDPDDRPDVHIVVAPAGFEPPTGVRAHHLLDDPYLAVVPVGHPFAAAGTIELAELAAEWWIDNDVNHGRCRQIMIEACQAAGFEPPFQIEANDYRTAIALVGAGLGITVVPALGLGDVPATAALVGLTSPAPERSIYALVPPGIEELPPVRTLLETLRLLAGSDATPRASRESRKATSARPPKATSGPPK
jgi:DNA-binding transcriptional LysR family regulator